MDKENNKVQTKHRSYNTQRVVGVWFLYIGVIVVLSSVFAGDFIFHPYIFGVGFIVGYVTIFGLPVVSKKLAYGKNTKFQDNMDNLSIGVSLILMTLCGTLIGFENLRLLWLAVFTILGFHLMGFYFSQGPIVLLMGALVATNGVLGLSLSLVPFVLFAIVDGFLKIGFGIYMISRKR